MEQKIFEKINIVMDKKVYGVITGILFPVVILLFCFAKVNQGVDITDSTYSLTNFLFADQMDVMWYVSTFFANLIGGLLVKLPMGHTLLMMNVYTGVFKAVTALLAYFFFVKTVKAPRELSFIGTIAAVGLCWCPTTILYNYLTYLLFLAGVILLYKGIVSEKNGLLMAAGFVLGMNFWVRVSNACEAALIIVLWAYCLIKDKTFKESFMKTLNCVGGYVIGLLPGVVLIFAKRGFSSIFTGISELFYMTGEASSYTISGMFTQTLRAYVQTWPWMEITFFMLVLALLAFLVLPTKLSWLRYLLATVITMGFGIFLYRKNLFTRDYRDYGSIYRFGALILSIMLIWFVIHAFNRKNAFEERILAFMGVVIIAITPIGSNNDIYANLNNMFFVFPLFFFIIVRFISGNEYFRGIRWSILLLTFLFVLQSVLFGFNFTFRDGGYYEPRSAKITDIPSAKGMMTTEANKKVMESFMDSFKDNSLEGKGLLLYGNVSGLGFYTGELPVISTAWPSLASFSADKFERDMKELEGKLDAQSAVFPTVIIGNEELDAILSNPSNKKQSILKDFISKYNYTEIFKGEKFAMFSAQ
ncbi:MAG: hypothetical protein J5626_05185 [Lachnospiraceae bacterium]|nr:hypothetical protein [Lachnospiraceae bacterium]